MFQLGKLHTNGSLNAVFYGDSGAPKSVWQFRKVGNFMRNTTMLIVRTPEKKDHEL